MNELSNEDAHEITDEARSDLMSDLEGSLDGDWEVSSRNGDDWFEVKHKSGALFQVQICTRELAKESP